MHDSNRRRVEDCLREKVFENCLGGKIVMKRCVQLHLNYILNN